MLMQQSALLSAAMTLLLFHLANAALLPMLSMRVGSAGTHAAVSPGLYAAATVVISQLVMIPAALWVSKRIGTLGYRPLIMAALLLLPLRALLAAVFSGPIFVILVQMLDGIAAAIPGVAVPGYIVSLLRGTGHVNAGQNVIMLMQEAGAALSPVLTGAIAARYSYSIAFYVLGAIALCALILCWRGGSIPDTRLAWADTKKAAQWAAVSGKSVCDHPLFIQFSGHVNTIVGVRFGDFVLRALFLSLCGDFGFCAIQSRRGYRDALCEAAEGDQRKSGEGGD